MISAAEAERPKLEVFKFLEEQGLDPLFQDWLGSTVLHNLGLINRQVDYEVLKYFLDKGADLLLPDK